MAYSVNSFGVTMHAKSVTNCTICLHVHCVNIIEVWFGSSHGSHWAVRTSRWTSCQLNMLQSYCNLFVALIYNVLLSVAVEMASSVLHSSHSCKEIRCTMRLCLDVRSDFVKSTLLGHIECIRTCGLLWHMLWHGLSVCLSVCLLEMNVKYTKTTQLVKMPLACGLWWTQVTNASHVFRGGPDPPRWRGNFGIEKEPAHSKV